MSGRKVRRIGFVKALLRGWLGVGLEQEGSGIDYSLPSSGEVVRPQSALTQAAVLACTRLLAQTVATLPLGMYERTSAGRVPADDLQVARVIAMRPNPDMSAVVFWETLIGQAVLIGNGFARKLRVGDRIVGLELMSADRMTWRRLAGGEYEYTLIDRGGMRKIVPAADVFHVPGFTLWGKFGLPVVQYGAEVFGSSIAANKAASSMFKNGLINSVYFKMERVLTKKQREEFRGNLLELTGAINAGKSPLLEGGMDAGHLGMNPDDAQLLESRGYSAEEICRWFGVPPTMIGLTDKASSWASSAEALNLWFLQYSLAPWLKRIEQAIWKDLLSTAEQARYYAEFSVEGLLRSNTAGRTAFYTSALQNGWMNRDEVRRLENLPQIAGGGGAIFTAQSNLLPLDQLGQANTSGAQNAQDALKAWLGLTGEPPGVSVNVDARAMKTVTRPVRDARGMIIETVTEVVQ